MTTVGTIPSPAYRRLVRLFHLVRIDRRHDPSALIRAHRAAAAVLGRRGAETDTPAYAHARRRLLRRALRTRGRRGARRSEVQVRGLGGGPEDFLLLGALTRCSARRRAAYALALLEGLDDTEAAACLKHAGAARRGGERAGGAATVAAVATETRLDARGQLRVLGHPLFDPTIARVAALPRRRAARRTALAAAVGTAIAAAALLASVWALPQVADRASFGLGAGSDPESAVGEAVRSSVGDWIEGVGPAAGDSREALTGGGSARAHPGAESADPAPAVGTAP